MNELKNHYANNRTILKDVLPLEKPLCISIEPSNLCNFKCSMCFHGNMEYAEEAKPLRNMNMECFHKIINDLINWGDKKTKVKLIKLYSLGEPLLHPQIGDMVKIIKEADICEQIEITTNASLLSKEVSEKLVDFGLDILRVSVYGADDSHMKEITKSGFKPSDIVANVKYLKEYRDNKNFKKPLIIAKMLNTYTDENEKFADLYSGVTDEIGIDEPFHLPSCENDIFENLYHEHAEEAFKNSMSTNMYTGMKVCRYPFTHLTVRNDGTCVVCCADWLKELRIGNVMECSLKDIWESKSLYNIRCRMIKSKGKCFKACAECEIPFRDAPEDNIDDFPIERLSYSNEL